MAIPIIDFDAIFGLFGLAGRRWWLIGWIKLCTFEGLNFERIRINVIECTSLESIRGASLLPNWGELRKASHTFIPITLPLREFL